MYFVLLISDSSVVWQCTLGGSWWFTRRWRREAGGELFIDHYCSCSCSHYLHVPLPCKLFIRCAKTDILQLTMLFPRPVSDHTTDRLATSPQPPAAIWRRIFEQMKNRICRVKGSTLQCSLLGLWYHKNIIKRNQCSGSVNLINWEK